MSGAGGFHYLNENIPEFPDHYARGPRGNSASMKAAADPDSKVLQAVLENRKGLEREGMESSKPEI